MLANSILVQKLIEHCEQSHPTQASLAACCKEIQQAFQFDCVFIAHATTVEEIMVPLAYEGKEEVMDSCLYRLGVEERVALSKMLLKSYSDITGKPVFNKSGSLRIQKPNSGIFLAYTRGKQDFLLLGCGHLDSKVYDQKILTELTNLWKPWQETLRETIQKIIQKGKVEPPQTTMSPASTPAPPALAPLTAPPPTAMKAPESVPVAMVKAKDLDERRPVVLVDEVTRLFNKDYFEECLAIEVERAKRYSRELSIVFLKVTFLNPTPPSGQENAIANQVAEILVKSLRRVDIICRIDQHKYGIILPDTANNTYGVIAKRVFKFFKQIMGDSPLIFLNISASSYPKHAGSHLLLLENAEKLLLQAQEVGPNKAVLPE